MATRQEYNTCMKSYMTGTGMSKEERQSNMCLGAKLCSGKASNKQEAAMLCQEAASQPKEPKTHKSRGRSLDTAGLAKCVIAQMPSEPLTVDSLSVIIASCTGRKAPKAMTQERFIKQCFKENSSDGSLQIDIKEAQKLRSLCTAKWKEQEAAV